MTIKEDVPPIGVLAAIDRLPRAFPAAPAPREEQEETPTSRGVSSSDLAEADEVPPQSRTNRRQSEVSARVLRGCIAQDEGAFTEFVVCYQHLVFAILSRRLGYGPHVEDLAQDTFCKAYVSFPHFEIRDDAPPSTWLSAIARNVAKDEKRRRGIVTIAASDVEPTSAPPMSERALALRRALSELPEHLCEAFLLHELEGMSLREVARIMKVAPNTVGALVDDAVAMLKRRLSRRGVAR